MVNITSYTRGILQLCILSVGNPTFQKYVALSAPRDSSANIVGGIYPTELLLESTSTSSEEVHFLGMTITSKQSGITLDLFDKRAEFPFQVIRFPHLDSVIPTNIPYGSFTGGLYRRYRICNVPARFVERSVELARILVCNRCSRRKLWRLFRRFLVLRRPLRWKCKIGTLCRQFTRKLYDRKTGAQNESRFGLG